jgi:hypothetical protein
MFLTPSCTAPRSRRTAWSPSRRSWSRGRWCWLYDEPMDSGTANSLLLSGLLAPRGHWAFRRDDAGRRPATRRGSRRARSRPRAAQPTRSGWVGPRRRRGGVDLLVHPPAAGRGASGGSPSQLPWLVFAKSVRPEFSPVGSLRLLAPHTPGGLASGHPAWGPHGFAQAARQVTCSSTSQDPPDLVV